MGIELCQELAGSRKAVAERICLVYVIVRIGTMLSVSEQPASILYKFVFEG
jgi:hypothetical protein